MTSLALMYSPQIKENSEQLPNNSFPTTLLNEHTKVDQKKFSWLILVLTTQLYGVTGRLPFTKRQTQTYTSNQTRTTCIKSNTTKPTLLSVFKKRAKFLVF